MVEKIISDQVKYYADLYGFGYEDFEITTRDGYVLELQHVYSKNVNVERKGPVLLQHGLYHCSGVFVCNEEESIAFYLAERGYDVWLGNNRGVQTKHRQFQDTDKRFWNWSVDHLVDYDFPANIDAVLARTGAEKLVFIGHSQGNAQAFAGLSTNESLHSKIKLFVAFGPAIYVQPLTKFPLTYISQLDSNAFRDIFGENEFLPALRKIVKYVPSIITNMMSYLAFSYLFGWSDTNWIVDRKKKYFLFSPRATSSKQIHQWKRSTMLGQLYPYEMILKFEQLESVNNYKLHKAIDSQYEELKNLATENPYNIFKIKCPMAVFHGSKDSIVDWERLEKDLSKHPYCIYFEKIEGYEHIDMMWAADAPSRVYNKVISLIESVNF